MLIYFVMRKYTYVRNNSTILESVFRFIMICTIHHTPNKNTGELEYDHMHHDFHFDSTHKRNIYILFWRTKHKMNTPLVIKINISGSCARFSTANTGIKMQPFPTSSASRNYSQYVDIDVVHTTCC